MILRSLLSALFLATSSTCHAEAYPARPVRLVTSFAPGGNADILARIIGEGLSRKLGQPFIIDNRPGASNIIGTQFVAKAPADGYTLLLISATHSINPTLFDKGLPYDTLKDFTGVTKVGSTPMVLVAYPGMGVTKLKDLIAKAKDAPGTINFSSSGNGSPGHIAGELLNALAAVRTTHIPYKGTQQSVTDTMSGQVQLAYPSLSAVGAMIKSGKLQALGITSHKRSSVAPDIPAISETLPGFEATIWTGVVAPAGVPKIIIDKLNHEIVALLKDPEVKAKLEEMGVDVETTTPSEFDSFIDAEIKKWAPILSKGNLKEEMRR